MKRVINKFGTVEKAHAMLGTFRALEQNRKPVGCVHDTADGFLIAMTECGFSEIELRSWFKVGGHRVARLKAEMKDPTIREKKLLPKTPPHTFCEEHFERLKADVACWNPRLEDGYPCLHSRQKSYFVVKPNQCSAC